MQKVIYISGPYRNVDLTVMNFELGDELEWGALVASAGHIPIMPLNMTVPIGGVLSDSEWIERDCLLLRSLYIDKAELLVRPGWCNTWRDSKGVAKELSTAQEIGMKIFYGTQDKEVIQKYLIALYNNEELEI